MLSTARRIVYLIVALAFVRAPEAKPTPSPGSRRRMVSAARRSGVRATSAVPATT